MSDNWKHRSAGMRCRTCMYYVAKAPLIVVPESPSLEEITRALPGQIVKAELPPETDEKSKVGRCRRHAPTMNGWPVMFQMDWCGDHKLDEEKL